MTISIIPRGYIGYVQVLDISVNKIIKQYLKEYKEAYYDEHIEEQNLGKVTVGDRRVLITHWVGIAWERLHVEHKETIIKTFRQVGLSLAPDGSKDSELKIRDLPNISVRDYNRVIVIPDDDDAIQVESSPFLYTMQELIQGIKEEEEDLDIVTTDSGNETNDCFDCDSDISFDDEVDGDEEEEDCNMDQEGAQGRRFLRFLCLQH